jgi:tyrosine-protein kinase
MNALGQPGSRRDVEFEERIDVRRYLDALRRNLRLIVVLVVVITGTVLALSLTLPKTYTATARVVFEEETSPLAQTDAESVRRHLATTQQLITAPRVLDAAARRVGERSIDSHVDSSVDDKANIINVVGKDQDPQKAADIANAVASSFLAERAKLDRARLSRARADLESQITQLQSRPGNADQIAAIRDRLSQLSVSLGSPGSDLQIAERAQAASSPTSPRPLRNTVLALFVALFLGILIALGRDQLRPRLSGTRELSRLLELPVLIGVPYVRRGFRPRRARVLSGVEEEAYQTLRATLEFSMGDEDNRAILITGGLHGEGKTTATARLGRALARAGHKTLLISADMRVPKLHEQFGLPLDVGLADMLAVLDWEAGTGIDSELLERATKVVMAAPPGKRQAGHLHVITSGTKAKDPGRLVSGPAMRSFLEEVRNLDYDYVLIDAPPLLGLADAQVLSQWTGRALIVCRLDRLTVEHVGELREVLDRLATRPLGLVVIGVTGEISPYYLTRRPAIVSGETQATA